MGIKPHIHLYLLIFNMVTTIFSSIKSARTSSTVHSKNLAHVRQISVPRCDYQDQSDVSLIFEKANHTWQCQLSIELTLQPSHNIRIYCVKTHKSSDIRFVRVQYENSNICERILFVKIESLNRKYCADLAYENIFEGYSNLIGYGHVVRITDNLFRSVKFFDLLLKSSSAVFPNISPSYIDTFDNFVPQSCDDPSAFHSCMEFTDDWVPQMLDSNVVRQDSVLNQPLDRDDLAEQGLNVPVSASSSLFTRTMEPNFRNLSYNDVHFDHFFCDAISASSVMESRCDFVPQMYDPYKLDLMVPNTVVFLTRSYIKRTNKVYKNCKIEQKSKNICFNKEKSKLKNLFEPQMLSRLASGLGRATGKTSEIVTGISDVASAIQHAAKNGISVDKSVFTHLDGMTAELGRFNTNLETISDRGVDHSHVHSFDNPFKNLFSWIYENRTTVGIVCILILILVLSLKADASSFGIISSLCILGGVIVHSYFPQIYIDLWDKLKHYLEPDSGYVPQFLDHPVIRTSLLLSYIFGFKGLSVDTLTSRFDKFCSVLSNAPTKTSDVLSTISFYLRSLQDLFNTTLGWCGVEWKANLIPDQYPASTKLLDEAAEFMKTSSDDKTLMVSQASHTCQILQSKISDMMVKLKNDKDAQGDRVLLMRALSKLEAYDKELDLRGAGRDITRVPPKAYLFIGESKIGKSYLLKALCTMALYKILENDPIALKNLRAGQDRDYIFTRNSADKFWEGYYNQLIVILDEVGMQADVKGADADSNEYSSFIKMVNDVVFPLNMAAVDKKGTREFNSPIILGTSNSHKMQIESITNAKAYDRRWTSLEVKVNKLYGKWMFGNPADPDLPRDTNDWLVPDFDKMAEAGLTNLDIALSRFLTFRQKASIIGDAGYKGEEFGIDELIQRIRSDLDDRNFEMLNRKQQKNILHDHFCSYGALSSDFVPQMKEFCPCKVCDNPSCVFTPTDIVLMESFLGGEKMRDQFVDCYNNGWDHVQNEDSYNYAKEPTCFFELKKRHPSFDNASFMFTLGCNAKSKFLQALDLNDREGKISNIKTYAKYTLGFIGTIFSLISIWKLGSWLFGSADAPKTEENWESQQLDLNAQEVLSSILKRNVYSIGDDVIPCKGFVTFLTDNILLLPKHYITRFFHDKVSNPKLRIILKRLGDRSNHQEIKIPVDCFLRSVYYPLEDQDIAAVYLEGRVVQKHASIRQYLMNSSTDHNKGEIIFPNVSKNNLNYKLESVPFMRQKPIGYNYLGQNLAVKEPICYRFTTVYGDCGLPIALKDPFLRAEKIFGIHVSGIPSLGIGASIPVTTHLFDDVVDYFGKKYSLIQAQYRTDAAVILDMESEGKNWNDLFEVPEPLEVSGKVNLGYIQPPNIPCKSSIIPSPLFKNVGSDPKTKPARLRPFTKDGELIDPLTISTTKYHRTTEQFDLDVLDLCKNSVTDLCLNGPLIRHHPDMPKRELTFEEAVAGIDGVEGHDGIPRKTSAGYPRCMYVEGRGKSDFFGKDGDYEFESKQCKELRKNVETIIGGAKQGKRGNHVFLDFPKDERRPKAKVDAGKTRKISACPIDLAVSIRKMFGSFVQHFMYNRIFNQSAVGVNVFDKQWDLVAEYLGVDNRVIAGDFGNYDGTLPYSVMVRFLDTVTEYYGDKGTDTELCREVLFQELANSRHIMNGVIYEWVGSNASGNPLTTVLNSWCNLVLLRYSTLVVLGKCNIREGNKFLREMDKDIRFMVYGDDNLISINRKCEYVDHLTQDAYTKAFSEMGFDYTDELKSVGVSIDQNRSITDVSFLKRRWTRTSIDERRTFLSPLDLGTILESIQWTKRKDLGFEFVKDNCVNMLQELSQHDESTFNEWAPKIVHACKLHLNFTPIPNNYRECQLLVLTRDMSF